MLNPDKFNMFYTLTFIFLLYYDCSYNFITYQEKLRDWPVEASATSAQQEGANSSKSNFLADKSKRIFIIQPSFLLRRGFFDSQLIKKIRERRLNDE